MGNKVKKFKLKINPYWVEKKLKDKNGEETLSRVKDVISKRIDEIENLLLPATVYETFKPEQILPLLPLKEYFPEEIISSLNNCISLTVYAVSLGEKTESWGGDDLEVYRAIIESAREQAVRFVYRLVNEEAKKENYLLGTNLDLPIGKKTKKVFELIDLSCIGLKKEDAAGESTGLGYGMIPWLSNKSSKKKKSD